MLVPIYQTARRHAQSTAAFIVTAMKSSDVLYFANQLCKYSFMIGSSHLRLCVEDRLFTLNTNFVTD
jgi:hypothetical protein